MFIFLYVYDKLNKLNGQYILESKNYTKFNNDCIIFSFYELNSNKVGFKYFLEKQ